MGRTILEVIVTGRRLEEVQNFLNGWFSKNGFEVKEWYSDSTPFTVRASWSVFGFKISPHIGSIVAVRFISVPLLLRFFVPGGIVLEISLQKEWNNTLLHGEFYVAGVQLGVAVEWGLSPAPGVTIFPANARHGYEAMTRLLQQLEDFSGQPLVER